MSLILEALKKSEQQRRLGELPTLGSPAPLARRRRSVLPLLVVLILAALGIGWWLSRTPAPPVAEAPLADATAPAPQAAPAPVPAAPPPAAADRSLKPVQPKPAAPAASAPVAAPVLPMPTTDRPGSAAPLPSMPIAGGEGKPHAPPAQPEAESGPLLPKPAPVPAAPAAATPPPAAANAATDTPAAAPAPAPATTPAAVPPRTRPARPPLPLVWELPYATRKDLPELALTMHVYSEARDERFVVIKGERHGIGDDLGNQVLLRDITPDGMVLEYKGQRFLFPREGR